MTSILLVDDEHDILDFLSYNLKKEGYEVAIAENGKIGFEKAKELQPDLILLDIMMPEMDGIETCKQIKTIPSLENTIIAFLTARGEDYSQVAGFDVGADDYITKPISPKVLISRIKALLRRGASQEHNNKTQITGPISIDKESYTAFLNGRKLNLPKKEFELLLLLTSKPGKVFRRDEIMNTIWGEDVIVGDRTIDVHIRKLREKIGEAYFTTIKGIGYKFEF